MSENRPSISDAEWRVMHEIWQCEPITSSAISSRLSDTTDWTPGTIKTLLHRLVQKDILDFQRKGNRYLYRSNYSESQCIDYASDQLLHTVFKGRPVSMLAYLVESARLSGAEVESLRAMLREIQRDLPPVAPLERQPGIPSQPNFRVVDEVTSPSGAIECWDS